MIRFVARFVGLWLIAGALVAMVIDAAKTIAASTLTLTPVGTALGGLNPETVPALQKFVTESVVPHVGQWVWDPLLATLLGLPTFLLLGVVGGLLAWAGRKRRLAAAFA